MKNEEFILLLHINLVFIIPQDIKTQEITR